MTGILETFSVQTRFLTHITGMRSANHCGLTGTLMFITPGVRNPIFLTLRKFLANLFAQRWQQHLILLGKHLVLPLGRGLGPRIRPMAKILRALSRHRLNVPRQTKSLLLAVELLGHRNEGLVPVVLLSAPSGSACAPESSEPSSPVWKRPIETKTNAHSEWTPLVSETCTAIVLPFDLITHL